MAEGWIKLYRKSIDSAVFKDSDLWKLWCYCLMKANHEEKYVPIEGAKEPIKILPGQFITGRYSLHKEIYPRKKKNQKSPLTVWRWLQILKNMQNLNIETNNKYSLVTVINWDIYQGREKENEQQNEQQMNNRRTTDEQQMNTNKNDKNDKEGIYILPEWMPKKIWKAFLSHRSGKKSPVKKESYDLFITKFENLKKKGWTPDVVVGHIITRGWLWFNPKWVKDDGDTTESHRDVKSFFNHVDDK